MDARRTWLTSSGYIQAPTKFVEHLRKVCDKHGILLVADEIQTGFWRTGKAFAIEHTGVTPDLMVFAKGFANGMPISGIVSRKEVLDGMPAGSLVCVAHCAPFGTTLTPTPGWHLLRQCCRLCCRARDDALHAQP